MSKDFSNWYVIKRDNETLVPFDDKKITKAISNAIKAVDNIDKSTNELAEKTVTDEVLKLLNDHIRYNVSGDVVFSVEEIQNCVEKALVTLGLYEVAKEYITYREKRNQLRMMNSSLMQTYKDFVTKPISEVDEMRENANIDGQNPMGGILKFGSEASKTFVDLYLMKPQHVQYHEKGYIHVHDKDFYTFRTTTCLGPYTNLVVKDDSGNVNNITANYLDKFFTKADKKEIIDFDSYNWYIYSKDRFVKIKSIMRTPKQNEQMYRLCTTSGKLELTGEHIVPIYKKSENSTNNCLRDMKQIDIEVKDIQIGDCLVPATECTSVFNKQEINLIDEFGPCKDIFICESDLLLEKFHEQVIKPNVFKGTKVYKPISLYDYHAWREHIDIDERELHLIYKGGLKNRIIPAILPLTKELGKIIGYMFSEGSFQYKVGSKVSIFCNYDTEIINDFIYCMNTVFPEICVQIRRVPGSSKCNGCFFGDALFVSLFKGPLGYKHKSDDIHLPDWIFTANKEFLSGFFGSLIDGDGTVNRYDKSANTTLGYSSTCSSFVEELTYLLRLLGIGTTCYTSYCKGTVAKFGDIENIRNHDVTNFRITGKNSDNCLWFDSIIMRRRYTTTGNRENRIRNNIISIEQYEYSGFVYDIETENHYFNANGYVVHNCTQIDIKSLLRRGFHTGHGFLRTPSGIVSAAALSCIAIQSNQADQHGGQSIPNLDYGLAPYVAKTYIKKIVDLLEMTVSENTLNFIKIYLKDYYKEHNDLLSEKARKEFVKQLAIYCCNDSINELTHADDVETLIAFFVPYVEKAVERTDKETYQAMEAMVHNFNTLKSRSGGQVPFSSINFGTDTTEEGRMVSRNFLKAIDAGLGKHETSIFPVAIFQVKRGFNYNKEDPNYDLFELSCTVSSRRLFPNFLFEDSSFNAPYYKEGHPETLCAVIK